LIHKTPELERGRGVCFFTDHEYQGTEIKLTVSNRDTLRKQWAEIMQV